MGFEYETKVLDFDVEQVTKKLISIGADEKPELLMRRWVFDWVEKDSDSINEWIRLRDDGTKTTLTYKKKRTTGMSNTEEFEVVVGNFEKTAEILKKIPFKRKFYQESKRKLFVLDDIEFSIDTWPMLDPVMEIESSSNERVREALNMIGLKGKDIGDVSWNTLYDNIGIHLHDVKSLKFKE